MRSYRCGRRGEILVCRERENEVWARCERDACEQDVWDWDWDWDWDVRDWDWDWDWDWVELGLGLGLGLGGVGGG